MANASLVIENIKTNSTSVKSMLATYLTTSLTINFTITSGTQKDIRLYVYSHKDSGNIPDSISRIKQIESDNYTYNIAENKIIISFANNLSLTGGYHHHFYIGPDEPSSLSEVYEVPGWYLRAKKRSRPNGEWKVINKEITNDLFYEYGVKKKGYCYNEIKATYRFSEIGISEKTFYAEIASAYITVTSGKKTEKIPISGTNTTNIERVIDVSWVAQNDKVTLDFEITDTAGNVTKLLESKVFTVTRTSHIGFVSETAEVNPNPFRPYTWKDDIVIKHAPAVASGTESPYYYYFLGTGDIAKSIDKEKINLTIEPNLITAKIDYQTIYNGIFELIDEGKGKYDFFIKYGAIDGFGVDTFRRAYFTVDFNEPPVFILKNFKLKHDYDIGTNYTKESGINIGTEIASNSSIDLRMFNKDEGLIFVLPKASTPNGEIANYNIYLSRNILNEDGNIKPETNIVFDQSPWLTIPISTLENCPSDNEYYYYRHKFSQYTKNEYLYFKVKANNEEGVSTDEVVCQNYIFGCRTVAPNFNIGDIVIKRDGDVVNLSYNFKIIDLGGSATADGWNSNYYSMYPNFERNIANYTRKAQLKIELAPSKNFDEGVITYLLSYVPGETDSLLSFSSVESSIQGFSAEYSKVFVRFTLAVSYGIDSSNNDSFFSGLATISSIPQIVSSFGAIPTLAHRAHHIGINTDTMSEEDVLVIENYQNRRFIVLSGLMQEGMNTITIDLTTGTITGVVISGGTWDNNATSENIEEI